MRLLTRPARLAGVTAILALLTLMSLIGNAHPAAAGGLGASPAAVAEAPDYATSAFSDPWDYSNPQDLQAYMPGMANSAYNPDGTLSWDTNSDTSHWADLIWYLPNSMDTGRNGKTHPIDANTFTWLSYRLYSSQNFNAVWTWDDCDWTVNANCKGAMFVNIRAGWNTYDSPVTNNDNTAPYIQPWSGAVHSLRFIWPAVSGIHLALDWTRVHAPGPSSTVTVPCSVNAPVQVDWDSNTSRADNTSALSDKNWGPIAISQCDGTSAQVTFDAAAYPPGSYWFVANDGRGEAYAGPLAINPQPQPVIYAPSMTSGPQYTDYYRGGQAWLSRPSDLANTANIAGLSYANGVWSGANAGPEIDNPLIWLPLPAPFSGSVWHYETLKFRYDGPFGLLGGPTGGSVARAIWFNSSDPRRLDDQNGVPVISWPGPNMNTYSFDLATNPPSAIVDPTQQQPAVGWAGQTITNLRFDPNEDVSARTWQIGGIELHATDSGRGAYDFVFGDAAWVPGTTANLFIDPNSSGFAGWGVSGTIPVVAGRNSYHFALPASLPSHLYNVYLVLHHPDGTSAQHYASAPVELDQFGARS